MSKRNKKGLNYGQRGEMDINGPEIAKKVYRLYKWAVVRISKRVKNRVENDEKDRKRSKKLKISQ